MNTIKIFLFVLLATFSLSCEKYLDASPDARLQVPETLSDVQGLLDYYILMNTEYPGSIDILDDNFYLTFEDWSAIPEDERMHYTWQKQDNFTGDWSPMYQPIYVCDLVLESLKKIKYLPSEQQSFNNTKGTALFLRASYFYSLAQLFAKGYNKSSAATDPGIPLRTSTDLEEKIKRATVQQTYDLIINDLKSAAELLQVTSTVKSRPNKAAAYGHLARTYLAMQDYPNAYAYSDSCLKIDDKLIDYNSLDSNAEIPIALFNEEVIFHSISTNRAATSPNMARIDSILYSSYQENDLRRVIYFKSNGNGTYKFKGYYDGSSNSRGGHSFTGIVTDEQYLIKAESAVRIGNTNEALYSLNALLEKRWRLGYFDPITSTDPQEILSIILAERRKELLFRSTRLTDLKRLNQDEKYAVTLIRNLDGQIYKLEPNSDRYVDQIPQAVIDFNGIEQNP